MRLSQPSLAALALLLTGCLAQAQGAGEPLAVAPKDIAAPLEPLAEVEAVTLRREPDSPALGIVVHGQANTGGWVAPRLVRLDGIAGLAPAPEGVATFLFVAQPPQGMATQAFTQVEGRALWPRPPRDLRGVRVIGRQGCAGAWLDETAAGDPCGTRK